MIEWSQKNKIEVSFELIEQFFDKESNPVFQTEVRIEGLAGGNGTGYSKKESQQNAAQMALKKIKSPEFMANIKEAKAQASVTEVSSEEMEGELLEKEETILIELEKDTKQKETIEG